MHQIDETTSPIEWASMGDINYFAGHKHPHVAHTQKRLFPCDALRSWHALERCSTGSGWTAGGSAAK